MQSRHRLHPYMLLVLVLSLAVSGCTPGAAIDQPKTPTPTTTRTPAPTKLPPMTPTPQATYTPTPLLPGSSLSDPLSLGDVLETAGWQIQVLEVIRGDQARRAILSYSPLNTPPGPGEEFLLLNLKIKSAHTGTEGHEISACNFNITGDRRILYSCWGDRNGPPEPGLHQETLYPGDEIERWLNFTISKGEEKLVLLFDGYSGMDWPNTRYLALSEGASFTVNPELEGIQPNLIGKDVNAPAQLNETVVSNNWEITVTDTISPARSLSMIYNVNPNTPSPGPALQYVGVYMHIRYIGTHPEPATFDINNFSSEGSSGWRFEVPRVFVERYRSLDLHYLYPGAEIEGWVFLQGFNNDKDIVAEFNPPTDQGYDYPSYFAIN